MRPFEQFRTTIATHRGLTTAAVLALLVIAGAVVAAVEDNGHGTAGAKLANQTLSKPFASPPGVASGGTTAGSGLAFTVGGRSAAGGEAAAPAAAASGVAGAGVMPQLAKGGPAASLPNAGPKIVKTSDLRLRVAKGGFDRAFDRASSVAEANGGFVVRSSRSTTKDEIPSGDLVLRVKADRFDAARKALSELGKVENDAISGEDVTSQIVDFDARIRSLQAEENTLRTLLSQAKSVGEILPIQQQLFDVRQQIEQLQAQRQQLDDAASLATIRVSVFEPGAAPKPDSQPRIGLAHSAERAWHGARDVLGGMLITLGYASPLVVLALLAWAVLRLRRNPAGAPEAEVS